MNNITKKISINLGIIATVFVLISLYNKLVFVLSNLNKKLYEFNSYYYQWKFGKIHYTVSGTGAPILLIHSLKNGASSYEFNKIVKSLSKTRKVYVIDLIGYGKSEKPKITYTAYLFVQLLNDFQHDVIQSNTDIISSGNSNSFVTMLCLQNPAALNKLIFINPGDLAKLSHNPASKHAVLKYILETPIFGTFIYNMISCKRSIHHQFKKQYFYNSKVVNKHLLQSFYVSAHLGQASNKFVYASNFCNYNNVNITSALKQINNSIYIIQGSDRLDSFENVVNDYKHVNAAIESSMINKTKEFPHLEKPKAILEILSIYLT